MGDTANLISIESCMNLPKCTHEYWSCELMMTHCVGLCTTMCATDRRHLPF